ncbi:MAG: hypothetical protein ABII09_12515 [Planctomycetota bacterium]
MNREENLLIAKNLLLLIEKLQAAGRRGDIVGVIANELDAKDRKNAQQVEPTLKKCPSCGADEGDCFVWCLRN